MPSSSSSRPPAANYAYQPFPVPHPLPSSSTSQSQSQSLLRARTQARTPSAAHSTHSHHSHRSHRSKECRRERDSYLDDRGDTASESGYSVLSAFQPYQTKEDRARRRASKEARRAARAAAATATAATPDERDEHKRRDDDPTDSPLRRAVRWTLAEPALRPHALWLALAVVLLVKWCVGLGGYSGYADPPLRGDLEAQRHWLALTSSSLRSLPSVPFLPFLKLHSPPAPSSNTSHPPSDWYFSYGPDDGKTPYWNLDYPPLTAYHSFLVGAVARLSPSTARYVTLRPEAEKASVEELASWEAEMSRLEADGGLRNFMRASVVVGDLLVWVTAVLVFCRRNYYRPSSASAGGKSSGGGSETKARRKMLVATLTILLHPALILIDNGHFQYNSLMLGLTLHALNCFQSGHDLLGAVLFVLSLGFKQMALYYAPGVFAYLLGKCVWLGGRKGLSLFINLGLTVAATFLLLFLPLLLSASSPLSSHSPLEVALQVLHRIFPFHRGLFEDKVANVWCAVNVVVKLRNLASIPTLARLALVATAAAVAPSVAGTVWVSWQLRQRAEKASPPSPSASSPSPSSPASSRALSSSPRAAALDGPSPAPTRPLLPHLLLLSSLSFFLLSFQVHEKGILLPLMPLSLLMGGREVGYGRGEWEWGALVGNVGVFSMYPLLARDGVALQYFVLLFLWNWAIGYNPFTLRRGTVVKYLSLATYAALALIHLSSALIPPPPHLPDLFPVLNLTLSCAVFGMTWLWASKRVVQEGWALVGLGGGGL
ncbi:hypothetical protein JCM8097_008197 [Rhodosporidiobolus ruineniae]